ncbi:hypothetical protein BJ684DRAFT_20985 [Piptocephalis cylindrospora]|uniref:Uncharacterized protein n=1 Tax=Piptocephalis cylindrospora TaxID=1907219 RepID=A0A4P9Y0Y0_9FUNG|nr:hypothetical protein BJ684DRAFT_20985 [Piptocephalis cylindrospora]|eukprot:RKP12476.1 hypothetical protein BJ684DRAFT_20985 [Piptocephalis cylindrospora]
MTTRLRLDAGVEMDAQLGTTLLDAHGWVQEISELLVTWDWLRESGFARDPASLSVLLDACGRNGLYGKARNVWTALVEAPTGKETGVCLEELGSHWKEEELLTPRTLNAYVECMARCRDFDEALHVLQRVMGPSGTLGPAIKPEEEKTFRHTLAKLYTRVRRHRGNAGSRALEEWSHPLFLFVLVYPTVSTATTCLATALPSALTFN